ncbi:hypothetical protein K503DRAFT_221770 [Rhizopogon vinicolor AM-OR11-026]|uniref:Uncharacterized protein n=1 Tax=Rhizopogon vinicolor AM-OR11-026 TaxID=1314800 RepID=A0A1B7NE03_9AGAM|nr:hypothetical protein K503DRAFT_221770 [Rhizopogon vinicolor AM-OR11-026]
MRPLVLAAFQSVPITIKHTCLSRKHPSSSPRPSGILPQLKCTLLESRQPFTIILPPKCALPASHRAHTTQRHPAASTSLSPCSRHSNVTSFGVTRAFYHARTPGPKYAFLPFIILPPRRALPCLRSVSELLLPLLRHALRSIPTSS